MAFVFLDFIASGGLLGAAYVSCPYSVGLEAAGDSSALSKGQLICLGISYIW